MGYIFCEGHNPRPSRYLCGTAPLRVIERNVVAINIVDSAPGTVPRFPSDFAGPLGKLRQLPFTLVVVELL